MKLQEVSYAESVTIDREAKVIRGVKVLGRESKNGRTYSDRAMQEAAKLYEGCEVNVDHPSPENASKPRGVMEGAGWLRGVKVGTDGVFADLHYLESHPATPILLERAERNPDRFGLSHNADGTVRQDGQRFIVESIERVYSVDLVRGPATNQGLFESENPEETPKKMKRKLTEIFSGLAKAKPDCAAALKPLMEMDGEYEMEAAPAEAAPADLHGAFKAACVTVLDDDSLDMAAKVSKIKEILKAEEKLAGKSEEPSEPPAEDPPAEEEKVAEQVKSLSEQLAKLTKRQELTDMLEAAGTSRAVLGAERVKQLTEATDPAALLKTWPRSVTHPANRPSPGILHEQEKPLAEVKDAKDFAASIRD